MRQRQIAFVMLYLALFAFPHLSEASSGIETNLQNKFQESRRIVAGAIEKLNSGGQITGEISRLKKIAEEVRSLNPSLEARFQAREGEVSALGAKARDRQRSMGDGYRQALEEYLSLIDSLPPDGTISLTQLENLAAFLDKILHKKRRPLFGSLPYTHLNYPAKVPSADPPIKPAYKGGNKTVSPDDLKDTPEAPISEEIATLAQSLNWNPVSIYEYVKNTIETEWYWGCMKGAEETLHQKSGNDCDQASLFVALLRASGFPSRYVRGTIQFFPDINRAKNLTGIDDPLKIAEFFQKAGIPFNPIMSGGTISNFQIEHIWVESQIPYANYRGAIIDEQGKTWLGLDTSIKVKPYSYNNPLDILQEFSLSDLRDEYLGALQTQTPLEYIKTKIGNYLTQSHPDKTYNDLLLAKTLTLEVMNILPASMQFDQKTITHEYTEIPDELKHKMTFTATDMNNQELFTITLDTLTLSNQKIALSYEPETVDDQEIIDSYGGLDNTPAYLVKLRPILKMNGEMVVAGKNGLPMGADHNLIIEITSPNGTEKLQTTNITGNLSVIGIVAQKTANNQLFAIASEDDAEEILFKETQNFISRWNQAEDELASLMHLIFTRPIPTVVTIGGVIDVTYLLDIPHGYEWKGVYVDAKLRAAETEFWSQNAGDRLQTFMQLSALQGSTLENRIFEDDFQVDSISTAKLFEIANSYQTPILSIDKTNISTVLPTLPFDDSIKEDINNAVNQNLTVTIPNQEITYKDWTGIAYIKENLATKESGHMLSGMIAGGMTAQTPEQWANQYLMEQLGKPFGGKPNLDPTSAVKIIKIPVTDGQYGTVNKQLPQPLAVLVLDKKGIPVQGANVTFRVIAGKGNFSGSDTFTATTGPDGIGKATLTLGKNTVDNPVFIKLNTGDASVTQVGLNIITASAIDSSGTISIVQPFSAYGKPDSSAQIIKVLGDGNQAVVNNPAGSLTARVTDQYGNPISNAILSFSVEPAVSLNPGVPLPDKYRNLKFYKKEECSNPYPMFGECPNYYDTLNLQTGWSGDGLAWTVMGNTVNTQYTVQATSGNLPGVAFTLQSLGSRGKTNYYLAPGVQMGYIIMENDAGNPVNASKVGTQLKAPVSAGLYMYYDDYTVGDSFNCKVKYQSTSCWRIKPAGTVETKKITDGTVTFTPMTGDGSVTPTNNLGNGLYQTWYKTASIPAVNKIEAEGQATITVPEIFYDADTDSFIATSPIPSTRNITLKSGKEVLFSITTGDYVIPDTIPPTQKLEYTVFGVLPQITGTTPSVIVLDSDGYLTQDTNINYTITPPEYGALIADIDIYERPAGSTNPNDDVYAFSIGGDKTQGDGTATLYQGVDFDITKDYYAEVVLNRGSDVEIRGERVPLSSSQMDIDFAVCESPCVLGVKENLVYGDGIRDTKANVLVRTRKGSVDFTKLQANVQTDYGKLTSVGSGDPSLLLVTALDMEGKAPVTYISHTETAKSTLQADVRDTNNTVVYSRNSTEIYNFKYCKSNGSCYDFSEIISDTQYTTAPSNLNSQEAIEAWLNAKGSGLGYRGIGEIDATQAIIAVDSGDNNNASMPPSGTIRIDEEEIIYSGTTTTDFYVPALIATQRGANGTIAAAHGDIQQNTNISVSLRTTLTSALPPTDTIINVGSTAGAVKRRDKKGNTNYFLQVNNEVVECTGITSSSFIGCESREQSNDTSTPVFYEVGRLGALVSRLIDYETKNEIQRPGNELVVEIGSGTFIGSGKPISAALMLTHLRKEGNCVSSLNLSGGDLGQCAGVKTDGVNYTTCILDQLARGIAIARKKFYDIADSFPIITRIFGDLNQDYLYIQPGDMNRTKIHAKFKINNKATKALFSYTNYITSQPVFAYGGNALFWSIWNQYGFDTE